MWATSRTRSSTTALASLISISCPPFARAGQWDLHQPGQLSPLRDLRSRRLRTRESRVPPQLPYVSTTTRFYGPPEDVSSRSPLPVRGPQPPGGPNPLSDRVSLRMG